MRALDQFREVLGTATKGLSLAGAATAAGLPRDAIRSVLVGHDPRLSRVGEVVDALGLEFYIGPPRSDASAETLTLPAVPPEKRFKTFSPKIDLPVQGWAKCSIQGMLEGEEHHLEKPMPEGLDDGKAFYARAMGLSMRPEGIDPGDYCLVSPAASWNPGARVWFKDHQGRSAIKRLVRESGDSWILRGWLPPEGGRQASFDDQRTNAGIKEKGVVLAVWRGEPDVDDPPPLIPDPKPPRVPAPPGIVSALDLPQGSSVDDVIEEIGKRLSSGIDRDALREEMAKAMEAQTEPLRADIARLESSVDNLTDESALAREAANDGGDVPGARPVNVVELGAAAGGGAAADTEEVTGRVWFRRDWLDGLGLDPTRCVLIGVMGESMVPLLWPGAKILIDRSRTEWRRGGIFVLRTEDGLIVKRAGADEDGSPLLVNEHPSHAPIPLPDDAEIVGRVVWTAKTLIEE